VARPEKPINPAACPPIRRIAQGLRILRHRAGKSYRQIAIKAGFSAAALAAATSGDALPTRGLTLAFVGACNGDVLRWEREWISASAELHGVDKLPSPEEIVDRVGLAHSLAAALRWAGLTSHARIAQAADVSEATVRRALSGKTIPSCDTLVALLKACQLGETAIRPWLDARLRLLGLPASLDEVFGQTSDPIEGGQSIPDLATAADAPFEDYRTPASTPARPTSYDGILVSFTHLLETGRETWMQAELRTDLRRLQRGHGAMSTDLPQRLGPTLQTVCGIADTWSTDQQRARLVQVLSNAVQRLPQDMRIMVASALNLPGGVATWPDDRTIDHAWRYERRMMALSEMLNRGLNSVRRQLGGALDLLIEELIASYASGIALQPEGRTADPTSGPVEQE
jgi:transcriptional regulator with XRE-family HTH domain